jgi:DNA sulfur modification protein DndD
VGVAIEKIEFTNYRQYGTGSIFFTDGKDCKLSVIIAKNGTGKTTLLNSITWCLYEKEQQILDKDKALSVVSNRVIEEVADGDVISVSVAVTIRDDDKRIEFKRVQNFKKSFDKKGVAFGIPSTSKLTVSTTKINDISDALIEEGVDADIIVKKYFDPAIYDFYFFDGEKLGEFFSSERTVHIKGSIFNISQVTLLNSACAHVKKLRADKQREMGKNNPDLAELRNKQDGYIAQRNSEYDSIANNKSEKERAVKELDHIDEILRGYMPVKKLQSERIALENNLERFDLERNRIRQDRLEFIRRYMVLLKLYPRIKKTLQIIQVKEGDGDLTPIVDRDQIKKLLENIDAPCPICNNPHIGETGRRHLEDLLNKFSLSSKTSNYLKEIKGALENYIDEVQNYQEQKNSLIERELDLEENVRTAEDRLKIINSSLANFSTDDGAVDVAEVESRRDQLKHLISSADVSIGKSSANIKAYDKIIAHLQDQISDAEKQLGVKTNLKQQVRVLVRIEDCYNAIQERITTLMRKEIQATTWNIFDSMIWKKSTFGNIEIGDDYGIAVYNKDGKVMTGSLSATEQMALAYAFTLAIHEASGKNCPIVIDSPLGRVSDDNRENMAQSLLDISKEKQIIMLFTPDEFSQNVRDLYQGVASIRTLNLSSDEQFIEGI